jgi:hypothetical protein
VVEDNNTSLMDEEVLEACIRKTYLEAMVLLASLKDALEVVVMVE